MSPKGTADGSLSDIEQRLHKALVAEAHRLAQQEPPRLANACRPPRHRGATARHTLWRWAAATAAALLLLAAPIRHALKPADTEPLDRPASVSPVIDRAALYAALPHIPAPSRPKPPQRLVADRVITLPAPAQTE